MPSLLQVILKGDEGKRQFVAFYVKGQEVKAVASLGRGTSAMAAAELFRLKKCVWKMTEKRER